MTARQVAFHLTDRCNLNCQHCLRDPGLQPRDLPLALMERVLDEARDVYAMKHVALTGGEPTLHPQFLAVVDAISARDMTWHMVTNGSAMPWLAEAFAAVPTRRDALTMLDFSLDGASEGVHDEIRGAGSYREVMAAITTCEALGIRFVLQMVVHAKNQHEIEAFALQAAQLGAARVSFAWLQATGTRLDADLFVPARAWDGIVDRIQRMSAILSVPLSLPEGFPKAARFHVCDPFRSDTLHVDVEGRLNLCCQHAGTPADGTRTDIAGDLGELTLPAAHARLLSIIHATQEARLGAIAAGPGDAWDAFPCNWCLAHFGKPHWRGDGHAGPDAARPRWRGAWADGATGTRTRLPILR
jgi:organic radical activating enzyme